MSSILDALSENFSELPDAVEFEFLGTEAKTYAAPVVAMTSALEGYLPIPRNLNRLSRLSATTKLSKGSVLLSLANSRKLAVRGEGKAFCHHNHMCELGNTSKEGLKEFGSNLISSNDGLVALSSKLRIDGENRYLVFIDFACDNDELGERHALMVAKCLNLSGILVDSGQSYHFYSNNFFTFAEWVEKMGQALFFAPLTDGAWIAHQLVEKRAALRISRKGQFELRQVARI